MTIPFTWRRVRAELAGGVRACLRRRRRAGRCSISTIRRRSELVAARHTDSLGAAAASRSAAYQESKGSRKPVAVVTADGGAHWDVVEARREPGLAVLSERQPGLDGHGKRASGRPTKRARTGRNCRNRRRPSGGSISRTRTTAGPPAIRRRCWRRTMAASKWEPIKAAAEPPGAPDRSAYSWIAFANRTYGIIFGFNQPATRWGSRVSGVDGSGGCDEPPRDAAPLVHDGDARRRQDLERRDRPRCSDR